MHILNRRKLAFEQSEKEVEDLHQRTKEGIVTAKLAGKQIGRKQGVEVVTKKSLEKKQIILKHSKEFNGSLNDAEVMALTGLSRNTFYKYKKCFGLDYNDLIKFSLYIFEQDSAIRLKWQQRLEYIMIDEFQDIDELQYQLMDCASSIKDCSLF